MAAALYGTLKVHAEIVKYLTKGKCKSEFIDKIVLVKNKINELFPQDKVDYIFETSGYYEKEGIVFAGPLRLIIYEKEREKEAALVDFKANTPMARTAGASYNLVFADDKSVKVYGIFQKNK